MENPFDIIHKLKEDAKKEFAASGMKWADEYQQAQAELGYINGYMQSVFAKVIKKHGLSYEDLKVDWYEK